MGGGPSACDRIPLQGGRTRRCAPWNADLESRACRGASRATWALQSGVTLHCSMPDFAPTDPAAGPGLRAPPRGAASQRSVLLLWVGAHAHAHWRRRTPSVRHRSGRALRLGFLGRRPPPGRHVGSSARLSRGRRCPRCANSVSPRRPSAGRGEGGEASGFCTSTAPSALSLPGAEPRPSGKGFRRALPGLCSAAAAGPRTAFPATVGASGPGSHVADPVVQAGNPAGDHGDGNRPGLLSRVRRGERSMVRQGSRPWGSQTRRVPGVSEVAVRLPANSSVQEMSPLLIFWISVHF